MDSPRPTSLRDQLLAIAKQLEHRHGRDPRAVGVASSLRALAIVVHAVERGATLRFRPDGGVGVEPQNGRARSTTAAKGATS